MTATSQAILTLIAAHLELRRAELCLQRSKIAGHCSNSTVRNILQGKDHRITSLVDAAADLGLEVEIHFIKVQCRQ